MVISRIILLLLISIKSYSQIDSFIVIPTVIYTKFQGVFSSNNVPDIFNAIQTNGGRYVVSGNVLNYYFNLDTMKVIKNIKKIYFPIDSFSVQTFTIGQ